MKLSLKEWPLVAFTILVQAVAGAFVLLFSLVVINAHHFFPSGAVRLFPLFSAGRAWPPFFNGFESYYFSLPSWSAFCRLSGR